MIEPNRTQLSSLAILAIVLGIITVSWQGRLLVLILGSLLTTIVAYRRGQSLLTLLLGAFVVRIAIIVVDANLGLLKQPPIMPKHHERAVLLSRSLLHGQLSPDLGTTDPMRRFIAYLLVPFYALFGEWQVSGRVAIAAYSLGIGAAIYGLTFRLATRRVALATATATLLWPSILYRSTLIQREVLIASVLLTLLWIGVRWTDRIRVWEIPVSLALLAAMMVLREENLFLLAVIFGAALFVRSQHSRRNIFAAIAFLVPALAYLALNFGDLTGFGTAISPEAISQFAQGRAHGNAAYLVNLHYESWLDIVLTLPVKVAYYLFAPFPWEWSSGQVALVGANGMLLLLAAVLAIRGIGFSWRKSSAYLVPAAFLLAGIAAYAIIEMNYGAAFRRRIQFTPVILMFAALRLSYMDVSIRGRDDRKALDENTSSSLSESAGGQDA